MPSQSIYKEAREQLRTVRDLARFATSRFLANDLFFGHGSDSAWDEAVYLILHTLHLPLDELMPFLDARLTKTELRDVLTIIEQRAEQRIPAAYLTGEAWLNGFKFRVDKRTIIPRSFIAELMEDAFSPWVKDPLSVTRVLDLCTGSGCLAIIAAHAFPNARVDAVDISPDALAVATGNVRDYGLEQRVRVIESDLYAGVKREKYDLILSNPPYVTDASMASLPNEFRHEPALALAGGSDGLGLVRRILADAPAHLRRSAKAGGVIVIEVGHERAQVEAAFPTLPATWMTTSAGDDMVFLLTSQQLRDAS